MNDLVVSAEIAQSFPDVVEGLKRASSLFEQIKSFEDLERLFFRGSGLSPNTYRSYLEAGKQFHAGQEWYRCGVQSAGNGALMRIASVLIPHLLSPSSDLWVEAALWSRRPTRARNLLLNLCSFHVAQAMPRTL
jgi:ADP-ribosylglycohydrolase